ncbi:ubiquitinyl hydrolase [Multifurca ochricompacta]|uniref:Ubiquitin carboxyl-terminal hydrolase n=1 Tax=Multifurca ochricompacta TaxID=376703 RepID=A0AAD4LVZ5_9AGAM|nr:ubiquitinyl hydrolase [Multifurca ochricompacta]
MDTHIIIDELTNRKPPTLSQSVHREECTQCFDTQDDPLGIDVCLTCFNGGCLSQERHHAHTHYKKTGHSLALNVKRRPRPKPERDDDAEPPAKMTKLAIIEEREEDKYEHSLTLRNYRTAQEPVNFSVETITAIEPRVKALIDGVMKSLSSARQEEVQAWEEELIPCEHTLTLAQLVTGLIPAAGLAHCSKCDLKENLWLCLTCGALGCGRKLYGGVGGNSHALAHFEESAHPVCVKLGTITPEGNADIYCYACNESRTDPELVLHLVNFGINVQNQIKTEKSMTELQIEHNLNFDFSLTDESGNALEPVFGPGLTGLQNLGNSCYMASVVQVLFSLTRFQRRYAPLIAIHHWSACTESLPASCVDCQMYKLADGLLSGRYSHPRRTNDEDGALLRNSLVHTTSADAGDGVPHTPQLSQSQLVFQEGIRPVTFKALVGRGHSEFATMRQQDAEEFFAHLLTSLRRHAHAHPRDSGGNGGGESDAAARTESEPTEAFAFALEQRLQCTSCSGVRYRVDAHDVLSVPVPAREKGRDAEGRTTYEDVTLKDCIDIVMGVEGLEYKCPQCQRDVAATKLARFATFPDTLVIHTKKFQLVNWVPTKLDIPIVLSDGDVIVLDQHLGKGLQPGETELPDNVSAALALPEFNQVALAQLEEMGFPLIRCQKALLATGNNDSETAMEWLFAHMEDPDIDSPIVQSAGASGGGPDPSPEQISMLADMGFSTAQARKALRETNGDPERAIEWLFSHPDDTGEDERLESLPDNNDNSSGKEKKNAALPGSPALPARYRLRAFVSHKGPSVHSGHYVAHVRMDKDGWVLFNDEKVVRADPDSIQSLKALAYLYVFERESV